ncbi:acyl-CoA carboxylase epsilon subunit [Microbacterium sp. 179-I 1D1 NHS]|uniref:acyl-CoA carboxylase epsilon subunit n=1 Tax=unclassified Microbacterium TaxID=2609290 RepID=UPI003879F25B
MSQPDDTAPTAPVQVRRGDASPEELAAVVAVVSEALIREEQTAVADEPAVSAWRASGRGIHRGIRRDVPWGRWAG